MQTKRLKWFNLLQKLRDWKQHLVGGERLSEGYHRKQSHGNACAEGQLQLRVARWTGKSREYLDPKHLGNFAISLSDYQRWIPSRWERFPCSRRPSAPSPSGPPRHPKGTWFDLRRHQNSRRAPEEQSKLRQRQGRAWPIKLLGPLYRQLRISKYL